MCNFKVSVSGSRRAIPGVIEHKSIGADKYSTDSE